jgi:tRNA pseudouridine38-40 synthase
MNNYKMTVQYDGTRYSGWQRQGNTAQTIQYKLEQALERLLEEPIEVSGSGRTDAGVHAKGQVANFKTEQTVDCEDFLVRLNQALPEDIAVTELSTASPRFHARLSAKEKTYCYTINTGYVQDVFQRRYEYRLSEPMDLTAMKQAANLLLGTHDFRGFSTGHTKKSTVRYLRSIDFSWEKGKLRITYMGNGFLYNMVRILTGTLIEVGRGTRDPESVLAVFETKDRQLAGFTAPPQGLCLMQVTY